MLQPPPTSTLFPYTTLFRSKKLGLPSDQSAMPRFNSKDSSSSRKRGDHKLASLICVVRSEEHTSELQSHHDLVCRLLLEKKKKTNRTEYTTNNITRED